MKPLLSALLFLPLAVAFAAPALAETYIGFDGQVDHISWKNADSSMYPQDVMGGGLFLGYRISPYFGVELGYNSSYDNNKIANKTTVTTTVTDDYGNTSTIDSIVKRHFDYRLTIREFQLDGFAYLPLGRTGWFQPFVTAGLGYAEANARIRITTPTKKTDSNGNSKTVDSVAYTTYFIKQELDWRVGAGIEARVSDSTALRVTVRYKPYSFGSNLDGGASFVFSVRTAL